MASGAAPVLLAVTGSGRERRAGSGGVIPDLVGFLKVGVTPPAKPDSFPSPASVAIRAHTDAQTTKFTPLKRAATKYSRLTTRN